MDKNARGGVRRYIDTTKPEEYQPDVGEVDLTEMSLTGLADLYGSDKGNIKHLYTLHYEKLISNLLAGRSRKTAKIAICEIGVACGASLRMWGNYLPNSDVLGIDVRAECAELCKDMENVCIEIFNPVKERLSGRHFDLLIDDASHISEDILSIFNNSWATVRSGGYYVVEDLSCTYNPGYAAQFQKTFGLSAVNDRSAILSMIDELMREIDQRREISELNYFPQMLVIRKQ